MTIMTRFKIRRDAAANWTTANPVLLEGEPAIETDTRKVKYGDGVTAWNSLPYAAGVVLSDSLTAIDALTPAADRFPYYTGTNTAALGTVTAFSRTLLDDSNQAAWHSTLGLGAAALLNSGTSGGTVALCNGANTWASTQTFSSAVSIPVASGIGLTVGQGSGATLGAAAPTVHISARALSTGNTTTSPQSVLRLSWQEGTQDLGVGEGTAIAFEASLVGDSGAFTTIARIGSYKEDSGDTNRKSALIFSTSNDGAAAVTEKMRLAAAGQFLIGGTSPLIHQVTGVNTTNFQIQGTTTDAASMSIHSVSNTPGAAPHIYLAHARSSGAPTTQSGDVLGVVSFNGNDGSVNRSGAFIYAEASSNFSSSAGYGRLSFWTANGGNPAERMALDASGNLQMGGANTVLDANRLYNARSYTVAALPAAGTAGRVAYASDCRVFNGAGTQEGAGAGTGSLVVDNGAAWKIIGTNVTAVA